jgi:hypothetical protein
LPAGVPVVVPTYVLDEKAYDERPQECLSWFE